MGDTLAAERNPGDTLAMEGTQGDTLGVEHDPGDTIAVVGTQAVITTVPVGHITPGGTAGGGMGIIPVVIGGTPGAMLIRVGGVIRMSIHIPMTIHMPIPIPILILIPMTCPRRDSP